MANTVIQLKKSSTPSSKPTSLEFGELAINYADGKLYYKNTNSQIAEISGAGGGNSFGTVNANSVLIVADTTGDVLTLEAGQNITIEGDAINDKITISAVGVATNVTVVAVNDQANLAYLQANTARDQANAAFSKANNALANSTGTFAGSLTITGDLITQGNVTLGDASTDTITLNGSTISLGNNQSIDSGTLFVDAVNNRVGIGTTSPSQSLSVSGSISSNFFSTGSDTSTVTSKLQAGVSGAQYFITNGTGGWKLPFGYGNSAGTTTFGVLTDLKFAGTANGQFVWTNVNYNSSQASAIADTGLARNSAGVVRVTDSASGTGSLIAQNLTANGNIGIGIIAPTSNLHVIGTANITTNLTVGGNVAFDNINSVRLSEPAANVLTIHTTSTERLRVDANGNIGIGTTAPSYRLEVAGSFAAQTKSFVIDHHTKPYSKLVHGSLEGPENGVYYRGKSKKKTIELPDYWSWLVDEETITVTLTPIGKKQDLFVKEIKDNKVIIGGARTVEYYYTVYAERKDVPKLIVEC